MCAGWGDRDTPLHVGCQPRSLLTEGASGTVLVPLSEELELEQQRLLSGCPFSSGMSWGHKERQQELDRCGFKSQLGCLLYLSSGSWHEPHKLPELHFPYLKNGANYAHTSLGCRGNEVP